MPDALENRIYRWLEGQGYPLEMRAAAAFQREGFYVTQSQYFADPQSGEWRESDVAAHREALFDEITVRTTFAVECKTSPGHPWIVFNSGARWPRAHALRMLSSTNALGRQYGLRLFRRPDISTLPFVAGDSVLGYAVVQAFGKNDQAFAAAMSVVKAAVAICREADQWAAHDPTAQIVIPVIVIEAPLFIGSLGETGRPVLQRVDTAEILWSNPATGGGSAIIDLVTAEHVDTYVQNANRFVQYALANCEEEVAAVTRNLRRVADKLVDQNSAT